ncbi:MAG: 50S ribosomal protein L32 [Candidatus Margulisiibacteriota bacterium]|jgi:large subunit ribosomal protein L32
MPQPKKKMSKSKRDARRSYWLKIDSPQIFKCPQCGGPVVAHQMCPSCGTYKGRQILDIKTPKAKTKTKKEA